jgi:hypothetical protein
MLVFRTDHTCRIHLILLQTIDHLHIPALILKLYFFIGDIPLLVDKMVPVSCRRTQNTSIIFWKFWDVSTFWKIKRWFYSKLKKSQVAIGLTSMRKIHVILVELCMKLSALRSTYSTWEKKHNFRIKSEMYKWSIVNQNKYNSYIGPRVVLHNQTMSSWRVSKKKQELHTLRYNLGSSRFLLESELLIFLLFFFVL